MADLALTDRDAIGRVAARFDELVKRYGEDHRALDYGSRASQTLRFDVLSAELPLAGRRVLDVGCGMADLFGYLRERGIDASYRGVDASSRMIECARKKYPDSQTCVESILDGTSEGVCDIAIANGIFYLMGDEAESLMQRIVARMFELATTAVAFTSLSTWATEQSAGEFHADPTRTLEFCQTLTPFVRIRHDYLPHDFAVFLYKQAQGA